MSYGISFRRLYLLSRANIIICVACLQGHVHFVVLVLATRIGKTSLEKYVIVSLSSMLSIRP